ncbi:MAG: ASKHA domain-containing protein [Candidatus Hodarchaeota archaeon]
MPNVTVTFEPDGRRVSTQPNQSVLAIAWKIGLELRSECGGQGTCGKCCVHITPLTAVQPLTDSERALLSEDYRLAGFRLACQAHVSGTVNLVVTVPPATRGLRRRIQVEGLRQSISLHPSVQALLARIPPVDPNNVIPDSERVISEIARHFPTLTPTRWEYPLTVIAKTPEAVRKAGGQVTVILRNSVQLLDIQAGDASESLYGLAFDIGTSKLAGSLYSLTSGRRIAIAGVENPQLQFGEDLMTRLSYAAISIETRKELQAKVIEGLNAIIEEVIAKGVPQDRIYEVVVVGNTVMTSFFLGLDTRYLAYGPFTPPFQGPIDTQAESLGLRLPAQTAVHVLPNIAGFVGADAIADILATDLHHRAEPTLIIDIGTNSEVVLGTQNRISATSCAAGPAFEGAQIEHGMKAVSGAIERVTFDSQTMNFQIETIDDTEPIGICGSGVVDTIAQLVDAGFLSEKGRFTSKARPYLLTTGNTRALLLYSKKSRKVPTRITVSEHDISQLLLAKAAIQTGYTLLLRYQDIQAEEITQVFIAGAFGNYLNPASAQRIGLIPKVPLDRVAFIGNAALAGAEMALLSMPYREEAAQLAKNVEFLDLARHSDFSATYAASLFL